jgi:Flp pilus assembly pilin Flp
MRTTRFASGLVDWQLIVPPLWGDCPAWRRLSFLSLHPAELLKEAHSAVFSKSTPGFFVDRAIESDHGVARRLLPRLRENVRLLYAHHFDGGQPMTGSLRRFVRDTSGQDLIEYGLLIGIVTIAAITAIALIGPKVAAYFTTLNSNLP